MRVKKKPRIFIGLIEICDYTLRLAQAMRALGYDVTHVVIINETISPHQQRSEKPDRYLNYHGKWVLLQLQLLIEFFRNFLTHDVFIFNFGVGFFSSGLNKDMNPILYKIYSQFFDWQILKFMGKKIVVINHGCDIRHYTEMEKWSKEHGFKYHICMDCKKKDICDLETKKQLVKMTEKYADYIFSKPNAAHLYSRGFNYLWLPLNLSSINYEIHENSIPVILHAPSSPELKGTDHVLKAVERLKKEGFRFKFVLVKNMTHEEFMNKLIESDIVVDQLIAWTGGYSLFAIEGMATGNAVLSSVVFDLDETPKNLPIIPSNPDNIYRNLKSILINRKERLNLVKKGRVFVEKYHDHIKIAKDFLKIIKEV